MLEGRRWLAFRFPGWPQGLPFFSDFTDYECEEPRPRFHSGKVCERVYVRQTDEVETVNRCFNRIRSHLLARRIVGLCPSRVSKQKHVELLFWFYARRLSLRILMEAVVNLVIRLKLPAF